MPVRSTRGLNLDPGAKPAAIREQERLERAAIDVEKHNRAQRPVQEHRLEERTFSTAERDKLAAKGHAMPHGGFPIKNAKDLENAIQALGRAKNPQAAKAHINARPSAGADRQIPDAWDLQESAKTAGYSVTPSPFSTSKTSNWIARVGGLPAYIQNVAKGIMKSGKTVSQAIQIAIGTVKRWASGAGKVSPEVRAAAAKALAEWEAKRAESHAKSAAK